MLAETLSELGLRDDDVRDTLAVAAAVAGNGDRARVLRLAERVRPLVGAVGSWDQIDPWAGEDGGPEPYGPGVLPLLALVETAPEVVAWHVARGIPEEVSWASLADLGHQAAVHRATYGTFGLHAQGWLQLAWSGALIWLGRLQFNLQRDPASEGAWVLSTHIPPSGPLLADEVDRAFAAAANFFPRYFPDFPVTRFFCASWLLDPALGEALPGTNIARFGARWALTGEEHPGDEDALFFTFRRKGAVNLDVLPAETSLQRAILDRLRAGGHWHVRHGFVDLSR